MTEIANLIIAGALFVSAWALCRLAVAIDRVRSTVEEQASGILKASWLSTTAKPRRTVADAQEQPLATPDGDEMQEVARLAAAAERGVNEFLGAEIKL
jgi:hypothetical protein